MNRKEISQFFAFKVGGMELTDEQVSALTNALYPNDKKDVRGAYLESSLAMSCELSKWKRDNEQKKPLPMTDKEIEDLAASIL